MSRPRPRQEGVHAQAGTAAAGVHRQAWVRKHGHAQTGTCGWVQGGCGGMGGCMQVTIVNTRRKKKKKHLPTGTGRQA